MTRKPADPAAREPSAEALVSPNARRARTWLAEHATIAKADAWHGLLGATGLLRALLSESDEHTLYAKHAIIQARSAAYERAARNISQLVLAGSIGPLHEGGFNQARDRAVEILYALAAEERAT